MATSPSGRSEQLNTPPNTEEFADKVFTAALRTMETFNLYLGERLGWWTRLPRRPPLRPNLPSNQNQYPLRR
jgi:hypothetical protein